MRRPGPSCPPDPDAIGPAAAAVVRCLETADAAPDILDRTACEHPHYMRLATDYTVKSGAALLTTGRFEDTMRDYGRYLRQHGVSPEHIVICVHYALDHVPLRRNGDDRRLANQALWCAIEGYYADEQS